MENGKTLSICIDNTGEFDASMSGPTYVILVILDSLGKVVNHVIVIYIHKWLGFWYDLNE